MAVHDAAHGGALVTTFESPNARSVPVLALAAHPSEGTFATASADGAVRLWDFGSRKCLQTFAGAHQGSAWDVTFNEKGNRLVSSGSDGKLVLYAIT